MKMKINRACDLSSISVLPPHARRPTTLQAVGQASQLQTQQHSQQSFSQGLSSQHGLFSQFSQTSLDEVLANDLRYSSGERENSKRNIPSLARVNHTREESQMPISRNSTKVIRKWSANSSLDGGSQMTEELERRIGLMEASLSRFGIVVDSVQSDVMQVNKRTKELSLEVESIQQKLMTQDNSLQQMSKGQEDIKASLDGCFKSISEQLVKHKNEDQLQEVFSALSALPGKVEGLMLKLQDQLHNTFTKEMEATRYIPQDQKSAARAVLPVKGTSISAIPQRKAQQLESSAANSAERLQTSLVPKTELGGWTSVKSEKTTFAPNLPTMKHKQKDVLSNRKVRVDEIECRLVIESDEEIDSGFPCLLDERETDRGSSITDEVKVETARILRKARKRKWRSSKTIVIN
ncbi:putative recombination initiation defects 3 isoform X3 [Rhodamnia argentea]|uniref:Recombination initiation defects 3 isoform X3 n=1 Tax=Rhodamnia argentea TaxID=178133 RepID=A0A8B8Q1F4_9MYRT|nr:putative recombination initiation defects 3 isoform X3 [Rhodamnia argentea]